jgi:hypothetical protein
MPQNKKELDEFFDDLEAVCKKHHVSISHEDDQGAFKIVQYSEFYMQWMRAARYHPPVEATQPPSSGFPLIGS